MSVRLKLMIIVAFVASVPLTVSALMGLRTHQRAYDRQVEELHRSGAEHGASLAQAHLDQVLQGLSLLVTGTITWGELEPRERENALWLVYRQLDDVLVASLLDARGQGVGTSAYVDPAVPVPELAAHPRATLTDLEAFGRAIPLRQALTSGRAVGGAFVADDGFPVVPIAFKTGSADAPLVVAIGLSLRTLCRRIEDRRDREILVLLLDADRRVLCGAGQPPLAATPSDRGMISAEALLAGGWSAVARQPRESAFASSDRLRRQTLFWIGVSVVAALAAGGLLARSITRPVRALATAAVELGKGKFDHRVPSGERDELGALARAFNRMSSEIERRDAEIRAWNQELQRRVDEGTRELREAQEQLIQSRKMGAMSALGAGVAHEINNPLTGVLGLTQVMLTRARSDPTREADVALLDMMEREAQRIRSIVERLLGLIQSASRGFEPLDVTRVLDDALRLRDARIRETETSVQRTYADPTPQVLGDRQRLEDTFVQLIDNALAAMNGAGTLSLSTRAVEDQLVRVEIRDTGRGIARENLDKIFEPFFTTKTDWRGQGLGLALAWNTVQAHLGTIKVDSQEGKGTMVTISLPIARKGAHLA